MDRLFEINDLEVFDKIATVLLDNLYFEKNTLDVEIPITILDQAKSELKDILISNEFNIERIKNAIKNKSQEKGKLDILTSRIDDKCNKLMFESVLDHNSGAGDILMNFDWALKLIFGTSNLKSLNYSVLQLVFNTSRSKKCSDTVYEMKKDILLDLIHLFEDIDCS